MAKNSNQKKIDKLRKIVDLIYDPEMMRKIGATYGKMVRTRTEQGHDIYARSFAPYSPAYKRRKERKGTHIVNLTLDRYEGMLTQIDHVVFRDLSGVKSFINPVGDPPKDALGKWHQEGAGNLPVREWWGLSLSQERKIKTIITTKLDDIFQSEL